MGPVPFLGGADMSFLDELEAHGFAFRDRAGSPGDCLAIVRDLGWNVVRLRLWSAPRGGYGNLERMAALAARVRAAGLRLLLDLDYSDHWADPGKQTKPAAWRDLPFVELCAAVHDYTRLAVDACRPDIVQVGNEITPGMLWDDGRVGGPFDTEAQWDRFACLLAAGGTGVRAAAPEAAVMIHTRGGQPRLPVVLRPPLRAPGDLIGQSFYPCWHGTLDQLSADLADIGARYGRDVVVVETGYPRTLEGYPATPEGQAAFLRALVGVVQGVPGARGRGVLYWTGRDVAPFPDRGRAGARWVRAPLATPGTDAGRGGPRRASLALTATARAPTRVRTPYGRASPARLPYCGPRRAGGHPRRRPNAAVLAADGCEAFAGRRSAGGSPCPAWVRSRCTASRSVVSPSRAISPPASRGHANHATLGAPPTPAGLRRRAGPRRPARRCRTAEGPTAETPPRAAAPAGPCGSRRGRAPHPPRLRLIPPHGRGPAGGVGVGPGAGGGRSGWPPWRGPISPPRPAPAPAWS